MFCPDRCVHSTGLNTNREPLSVRHAAIMDFQRVRPASNLMWLCDGASIQPDGNLSIFSQAGVRISPEVLRQRTAMSDEGRMAQCPWPDDTLEYGPTHPPPSDMWHNWNLGRKPAVGDIKVVPPWWERHNVSIPTIDRPLAQIWDKGRGPAGVDTAALMAADK